MGLPQAEATALAASSLQKTGVPRSDTLEAFGLGTALPQGWSMFSIPIYASNSLFYATSTGLGTSSQDGIVDPAKVTIAYRFNASTQAWSQLVSTSTVLPLEGILINSSEAHVARLSVSTINTTPPTKALSAGWNLVGTASLLSSANTAANEALISAFSTPSGLVGYNQVVSPSINSTAFAWTRGDTSSIPTLNRWKGYWVFMENADTMAGFSSTPF
jgi:hypothetical protein